MGYGCIGSPTLSDPVNTTAYTVVCDSTSTCEYAIAQYYTTDTCNDGDDWEQNIYIMNDCLEYGAVSGIRTCDETSITASLYVSGDCSGGVVSSFDIIDTNDGCSDIISCPSLSGPEPTPIPTMRIRTTTRGPTNRPTTSTARGPTNRPTIRPTTTLLPTKQPTKAPELCNGIYVTSSADTSIYVIFSLDVCMDGYTSSGAEYSHQYTCIGNVGYSQIWFGYGCEGTPAISDPANTTTHTPVCDASTCQYVITKSYDYNNITDSCQDNFHQTAYVVNDCLEYNGTHSGSFACDGTAVMTLIYESGDCSGNILKKEIVFDGDDGCNDIVSCSAPLIITPEPTSKQTTISTTNRPTTPTAPTAPTIPAVSITPSPTTEVSPAPTNQFDAYATYSSSDVNKPILAFGIVIGTLGIMISTIFLCYYHTEIRHDAGMAKKGEALKVRF